MKMHRVTKNKEDCLRYIQYEMNMLRLVKLRRQVLFIYIFFLIKQNSVHLYEVPSYQLLFSYNIIF